MASILAAKGAPVEATLPPAASWQVALKRAIRDGRQLCARLGLDEQLADGRGESQFPVFAPLEFVGRMRHGDPQDPLLLQVLGGGAEGEQLTAAAGTGELGNLELGNLELGNLELGNLELGNLELGNLERGNLEFNELGRGELDPVGDLRAQRVPGLLQKYHGRALMMVSGACAIHCRYCFRRHFPYDQLPAGREAWLPVIEQLREDDSLHEVILSGGDPLMLVDQQL